LLRHHSLLKLVSSLFQDFNPTPVYTSTSFSPQNKSQCPINQTDGHAVNAAAARIYGNCFELAQIWNADMLLAPGANQNS